MTKKYIKYIKNKKYIKNNLTNLEKHVSSTPQTQIASGVITNFWC